MLDCEGYKMFAGTAVVKYPTGKTALITGRWLYRPDTGYWYVNGCPEYPLGTSFSADMVTPEVYL